MHNRESPHIDVDTPDGQGEHEQWLIQTAQIASRSLCLKSKCGALIVKNNRIIGRGYNTPPRDNVDHRMCGQTVPSKGKPKSDRTCCVHAEQRAILDAVRTWPYDVAKTILYFVRVDDAGEIKRSGKPYCTMCSKMALDIGIQSWVLWHVDGIREYDAVEYNRLSHLYDVR